MQIVKIKISIEDTEEGCVNSMSTVRRTSEGFNASDAIAFSLFDILRSLNDNDGGGDLDLYDALAMVVSLWSEVSNGVPEKCAIFVAEAGKIIHKD